MSLRYAVMLKLFDSNRIASGEMIYMISIIKKIGISIQNYQCLIKMDSTKNLPPKNATKKWSIIKLFYMGRMTIGISYAEQNK